MASQKNPAVCIARLEADLDAERRRYAEVDQAYRRQLDANRVLITEVATLKADLRHLGETTVNGLERQLKEAKDELKEVKDELSQERTKLERQLKSEARSARNRETNAVLEARNPVLVVSMQDVKGSS